MQIQKWESCFQMVIRSLFEFGFGLIRFRNWTHSLKIINEIVDNFIDNYLYFRNWTHV